MLLRVALPTKACKISSILSNRVSRCDILVSIVIPDTTVVVSFSVVEVGLIDTFSLLARSGGIVPKVDTEVESN